VRTQTTQTKRQKNSKKPRDHSVQGNSGTGMCAMNWEH
jgi:hypothetical protein